MKTLGAWSSALVIGCVALASAQSSGTAQRLAILATPRVAQSVIDRAYNDAIIKEGSIDRIVQRLTDAAHDKTATPRYRANACLVRAHVLWHYGRMAPALAAVDEGLALDSYDDLTFLKARLLDASGETAQARDWYQKAATQTTNPSMKETVRVRLTLADAVDQNVKSLVELAKTRPTEFRNRAAIALAMLGFNNEATDVYQITAEGTELFREHLRVAQWALRAGNAARAQDHAWQAVHAAAMDRDRRYALSLLVEAHSSDNSLPKLIDKFAAQPKLTAEEEQVRIDLLRQTAQYKTAIDLFHSAHGGELGPELRQELLRMYRDAGQETAMVGEYHQLITKEPDVIEWPEGLSQYYLEKGDQANARKVWEDYLATHATVATLVQGADSMTSFGLHDLAMAATEKALKQNPSVDAIGQVRMVQFELYRRRGLNAEAEATLKVLDGILPADSPYRLELADGYERLQKPQMAAKMLEGLSAAKGGLGTDDTMRLAWLFDSIGRRDDSLKLWRQLWSGETVEARRHLIEERLLLLAAELGSLGDVAVDLEQKLKAGQASPKDVSLLVSIYTKVGDAVSAIEVVTSAAAKSRTSATSEIASLKEQAQIYLALAEYPDYARVTRRLLEIDPANKVEYLQSLLLNQIEAGADQSRTSKDKPEQLQQWLDQLRVAGGDAVGAEFEAGVMDMAGFRDRAIDTYRRALSLNPERADNHLLLSDLLRQAGRQAEAVTSLQYVAEGADTDELFLIAVDGITNMRTGNAAQLKWAERLALERLTTRDDKLYLYEMVSDLAEEAKDGKVYIASLDNSLAHADSRRSYVLRELLAATAEVTTYEAAQRVNQPDMKTNVAYARRLIALGEELPPEVYVDLGRTFIKMKDPAAATRAFSLAIDRTGRTSVALDAAKLFEHAAYDREATTEYEKALIANADSIQTILRLAHLRERAGAFDTANSLYLRGLQTIISQQIRAVEKVGDRSAPSLESSVSFDYRKYYQSLLTGLLATLPSSHEGRAAALATLERMFKQELLETVGAPGADTTSLSAYPRLAILAQTVRTAALSIGIKDAADRVDAALVPAFGRDAKFITDTATERGRWEFNTPPASATTTAEAPSAATPGAPLDTNDYVRAVGLALNHGDQDEALAAYRQWAKYAGAPKPPLHIGSTEIADRSPALPDVAQHAFQRLDARHFGSLAQYIKGLLDDDVYAERILLELVFNYEPPDVPALTRLETALGGPLLDEERMMRLATKHGTWTDLNLQYLLSHLSADRQIDLLGRYGRANDVSWSRFLQMLGIVLKKPLDAAHATTLLASIEPAMQTGLKKQNGPIYLVNFMNYAFTAGLDPANVQIVLDLDQFLAEKFPQSFRPGSFKAAALRDAGRDTDALAAFVEAALKIYVPPLTEGQILQSGQPSPYSYQSYVRSFAPFIFPKHKSEIFALLDAKEAEPAGLTDALISLRIELTNSDPANDPQQLLAALQAMADRHPKNEQILNTLFPLYDQYGETLKAAETLTQLTKLKPDNRQLRYRLMQLWQRLDRPEKMVEVSGGKTMEEMMPVVQRSVVIDSLSGPPTVRFATLKKALDAIKAAAAGGDQAAAALGLRTLLQTLPTTSNDFIDSVDEEDPYFSLRDLMQTDGEAPPKPPPPPPGTPAAAPAAAPAAPVVVSSAPVIQVVSVAGGVMTVISSANPAAGGSSQSTYDRIVTSLSNTTPPATPTRLGKIMDVVVRYPFAITELEAFINTLRAEDIERNFVFYNWLTDAYVNNGRADAELTRRSADVLAGKTTRKDATIWLALAARQTGAKAAELADVAERGGLTIARLGPFQRILLARLAANAGLKDRAVDAYIAVATTILAGAANTLQPNILSTDNLGRNDGLMLFTGLGLFDEARQHVDAEGLGRLITAMLTLAKPASSPSVEQAFAKFAMILNVRASQAGLVIPSLQQTASALQPAPGWPRSDVIQQAFIRASLGKTDEALTLIKSVMQRDFDTRDPIVSSNSIFASRQYQMALGLTGDITMLGPFGTSGTGIEEFKPLFPFKADAFPGALEFVARAGRELPAWIAQGAVNRDAGVQLLCLVALRLNALGDTAGAKTAAKAMSGAMKAGRVNMKTATVAVSVADKLETPVELAVVQELVRTNRLHVSRVVSVLTRTAKEETADKALALGDVAATFSSNDDLLKQMVSIAQSSGNAAALQLWQDRQKEVTAARAALAKKPAGK